MDAPRFPELAPPGAGLPAPELWIGRALLAVRRRWRTPAQFADEFRGERVVIRRMVEATDPARRGERVLIPRPRGLEDSSRFWSVWMTLDHLRITNSSFAMVIRSLSQGRVPQKKASTADVKPDPEVTGAVEADYEASCDRLLETAVSIPDLNTPVSYAHPWFGPLDAAGWLAVSSLHMGLHREQIHRIRARL